MDDAQVAANAIVQKFMVRLADSLRGSFPHHTDALRGEIIGTKLTEDRWQRVGAVLASLHAIPGVALSPAEHDVRNLALSAVVVARKMAAAGFGSRDPESCRDFAVWYAADLGDRMTRNERSEGFDT